MSPQVTKPPVRVFISYAWEDAEYRAWVAQLASQLRKDGVDARLDRWHVERSQTIPEFMNSEVRKADKVLVLCSPKYQEKVHAMEDGGASTGSGWESMLLSSVMFTQGARNKVVTALARGEWQSSAPDYMQGLPYDDLTKTDEAHLRQPYISLLRRLIDATEVAPPIGSSDIHSPDSTVPLFDGHRLDALAKDRSVLPPIVTLPTRHRMPYRSLGSRFVGRIESLWDLHALLHQGDTAVVEGVGVVIGAGGLGKTQLATEYVHRFGNYYTGGVFWTDADQGLATVVQQIAASAHIDINGALPIEQQCEVLWQSLGQAAAPILIVFDNFSETEPLEPWLPVGANLKALVTTRRKDLAYPKIPLAFLAREEGLELLSSRERDFGAEAIPLVEALGGLPLALELSCNFLNRRPTFDIDALLAELVKLGELAALNVFAEHYKNELPTGHEKAVGATFQLSWDLASEAEQKLLKLMAWWAPSPIPRRLLKHVVTDTSDSVLTDPVNNGISALERVSLVELDEDYDPHLHRLLRGFVRAQTNTDDEEMKVQAIEAVKTELCRTQIDTDTAALTELEKILPHGQMVLDTKIAEPDHAIDIANYMSWHQRQRGRYQLAKAAGLHALVLAKRTYAPGHIKIVNSQTCLGLVLYDLVELAKAKDLLSQALESCKQSFEQGDPTIAMSLSNLATVLHALGELERAKTLFTEALKSDYQTLEPGHRRISIRQCNLALVYRDLGELERAKTLLTRALKSDHQSYVLDHSLIATIQSNLATVLESLDDLDGAKDLLTCALKSNQQNFEPDHPTIAKKQANLAKVLQGLGDLDGAKDLLIQSYESFKNRLGEDHRDTLTVKGYLESVELEIKNND